MAEDFLKAAVKRVEEQFAKSGVSESCAAFERKENQIEMRDGVKLHTIYYFPKEDGTAEEKTYPVILTRTCYPGNDRIHRAYGEGSGTQRLRICVPVLPWPGEFRRKMGTEHQ